MRCLNKVSTHACTHARARAHTHTMFEVTVFLSQKKGAPVDGQDPYGNTVLHTACQNGNKRILKACLRRGANTNAQNVRGHVSTRRMCGGM